MLVQETAGAILAVFIERACGLGAAETRAVGLGLLCRLFPLGALLESFQVDHVCHVRLRHPATRRHDNSSAVEMSLYTAQENWLVIRNPRVALPVASKNAFRSAKTE